MQKNHKDRNEERALVLFTVSGEMMSVFMFCRLDQVTSSVDEKI